MINKIRLYLFILSAFYALNGTVSKLLTLIDQVKSENVYLLQPQVLQPETGFLINTILEEEKSH